jgi:hypothetical protein
MDILLRSSARTLPLLDAMKRPNQSMERTAARCVSSSCVTRTRLLRFTRALGGGRSSPSR